MQILLKERVIRRDDGQARAAREAHARIMRDEGRMDVYQIEVLGFEPCERRAQCAPAHPPVFGIPRHRAGWHANHAAIRRCAWHSGVGGGYQHGLDSRAYQISAEGADRGGDAVDAREVDVGDEENPHAPGGLNLRPARGNSVPAIRARYRLRLPPAHRSDSADRAPRARPRLGWRAVSESRPE